MLSPQGRTSYVALQAVLPDGILMAVAAARPSTSSALMSCAQGSLHRDGAQQQQGAGAAPGQVSVWLRRHASEVSQFHQCFVAFKSLDFVA